MPRAPVRWISPLDCMSNARPSAEFDLGLSGVEVGQSRGESELHLAGQCAEQVDADRARAGHEFSLDLDPARSLVWPLTPTGLRDRDPGPARQPVEGETAADDFPQLKVMQIALELRLPILRAGLSQAERPLDRGVGTEPVLGIEEGIEHPGRQGKTFHRPDIERGHQGLGSPVARQRQLAARAAGAVRSTTRPSRGDWNGCQASGTRVEPSGLTGQPGTRPQPRGA